MKTAPVRSAQSGRAISSDPTQAPSAYSRLVAGRIVKSSVVESDTAADRLGPHQLLLRQTLIRGYGHDEGARRFDALEQTRDRLQLDDNRVRGIYGTLRVHVDAAIDRRLLQPLAAERDAERRRLTTALTSFTGWYRRHLSGQRSERQQLLPDSLLLQALDTLRAALDHDPLMSTPIDTRFKRPAHRQRKQEVEQARQSIRSWGIGKQHADQVLRCVGLTAGRESFEGPAAARKASQRGRRTRARRTRRA